MPFDSYVLGDIIGKGSYGEVTLARHKKDKRQYVIKKIDFHNASSKERLYAQQEVDILSKLKHPNIVSYKESFQTDNGGLSIVMGYCELGDLYNHLKKQSKIGEFLCETKIVEWFVQISMALQYMHDRHILHRDLKTQNIFLTKSKIIKLGDLGIARVLESNCDMATTMIGTPYYMSPELFSNKPYNHKSDVWALGCCLYEMCTLKHAFNARDMNSLVYKILKGKTPDMPSNYSSDLLEIIKSMLNYDPTLRPSASHILRLPYIKKQIALFLEGTKNRRHIKERNAAKEIDISHDSGFSEASNEDSHAHGIATASKIEIHVSGQPERNSCKEKPEKLSQINKDKSIKSQKHLLIKKENRSSSLKDNLICKPVLNSPISRSLDDGNDKKEHPRPVNVRKILSERIQAKARLKRIELEEKSANEIKSEIIYTNVQSRSEIIETVSCHGENEPKRLLPILSSDDAKGYISPSSKHSNKDREYMKLTSSDDEKPKVYAPNIAARKKRRLRQQQIDSHIQISPEYSNKKIDSSSAIASFRSHPLRTKEEIIKGHLSRAANKNRKDNIDGVPSRSIDDDYYNGVGDEKKHDASPEEETDEETLFASDRSEKISSHHDVSSLIDTLQATLTMDGKSKDVMGSKDFDAYRSSNFPSSATGRLKQRISILRKECVDGIGEELLQNAYEIINIEPEDDVERCLIKLLGKSKFEEFGGQIWQLKFCEEF